MLPILFTFTDVLVHVGTHDLEQVFSLGSLGCTSPQSISIRESALGSFDMNLTFRQDCISCLKAIS